MMTIKFKIYKLKELTMKAKLKAFNDWKLVNGPLFPDYDKFYDEHKVKGFYFVDGEKFQNLDMIGCMKYLDVTSRTK